MDVSINLNGDLPFTKLKKAAILAEESGFSTIWVGESIRFNHPFPVMAFLAHATKDIKIGSGIVSYFLNQSLHIKKAVESLVEAYGKKFAIAIAPGDLNSLRECGIEPIHSLKRLRETIGDIRSSETLRETPLYVGASGPKMIETGGKLADGVLLNYAHPEYVDWAMEHLERDTRVGVYAPAFLSPDEQNEKAALMASAFVAAGSNFVFQTHFGLKEEVEDIRRILREKKYHLLDRKKDLLLGRFMIYGDEDNILERVDDFRNMGVNEVILGSPFNYNLEAIKIIAQSL